MGILSLVGILSLAYLEKALPADQIDRCGEVDEGDVQGHVLFVAFLLKLADGEYHVYCRSLSVQATLKLGEDTFGKLLKTKENNLCVDFVNSAEEGDAPVAIAVASPLFVFVEGEDLGVPHVLCYSTFLPELAEDVAMTAAVGRSCSA